MICTQKATQNGTARHAFEIFRALALSEVIYSPPQCVRNARPLVFLLIKVNENEDYTNKPETVVPTDRTYSKLVEDARYKNPKVAIERLAIPNEIICTPKTQNATNNTREERKSDGITVTGSGRTIQGPHWSGQ